MTTSTARALGLAVDGEISPISAGLESGASVRGRLTFDSMSHKPTRDPARPNGRALRRRRKVNPESRFPRQFAVLLAIVLTALLPVASAAAGTAKPFASVQQTQTLILNSEFATNNGITDVTCVGLREPKPKLNSAGQPTYHRFRCHLSGTYFDVTVLIVLKGHGFVALPLSP